jgi:hypothetical protein
MASTFLFDPFPTLAEMFLPWWPGTSVNVGLYTQSEGAKASIALAAPLCVSCQKTFPVTKPGMTDNFLQ